MTGPLEFRPRPLGPFGTLRPLSAIHCSPLTCPPFLTPDTGKSFARWSIPGDANDGSTLTQVTVTMNAEKTATAIFEERTLTLTVSGSGQLSLSVGVHTYSDGDEVTITAVADAGWALKEWTGDASGALNPLTVTMDESKEIQAVFSWEFALNLSHVGRGGVRMRTVQDWTGKAVVDGSNPCWWGSDAILEARPAQNWAFRRWSGDLSGTKTTRSLTMNSERWITAEFGPKVFIEKKGRGTVTPSVGTHIYDVGDEITLTATPNEGCAFIKWGIICGNGIEDWITTEEPTLHTHCRWPHACRRRVQEDVLPAGKFRRRWSCGGGPHAWAVSGV